MQHKDMQRGMTRRTFVALAGALAVATSLPRTVMAAGAGSGSSAADSATDSAADGGGSAFGFIPKRGKTTVNQSPDKYTWYVKDYVGMNAAAVGYTSLGEDRLDKYGSGLLKIVYVASDGTYLNPTDEDLLKRYVVFAQNLQPNTEIKLTFLTDSDGKEYDSLVDYQSVEEIVLAVSKVGEQPGEALCMTPIEPSPDKYTRYVRDYATSRRADMARSAAIAWTSMARRTSSSSSSRTTAPSWIPPMTPRCRSGSSRIRTSSPTRPSR